MHTLEQQFGERVRTLRLSRGITQMELAEKAGITCQGISRIERGTAPPFHAIAKIAQALGVGPGELFDT